MTIYCGNNGLHSSLVSGQQVVGTRYQCLRKGIGRGMNMAYDKNFAGGYIPIDQRKIYCGNAEVLPDGYAFIGTNSQCLQKGVGIGKKKKAELGPPKRYLPYTIFTLFSVGLFLILYMTKPPIVQGKKKTTIDWSKFMAFYIPTVILGGVIMFLIVKYI